MKKPFFIISILIIAMSILMAFGVIAILYISNILGLVLLLSSALCLIVAVVIVVCRYLKLKKNKKDKNH